MKMMRAIFFNRNMEYLYIFSEFVAHTLRLQAQSEHKLSVKCINILNIT